MLLRLIPVLLNFAFAAGEPKIDVTHIGGPTALVEIEGFRILTDPTFDEGPRQYTNAAGAVLKKTHSPGIKLETLGKIDLILLSHDEHEDNLDFKGREFLKQATQVLTTASGGKRLGGNSVGLKPWESKSIKSASGQTFKITAVPARHGPPGSEALTGDVTGFIISLKGKDLIYVTGDTVWYEGTKEVTKRFNPQTVLAFAGGAEPLPLPLTITLDINDMLELAHALPKAKIIPVHQDSWEHFKQSKSDVEKAFHFFKMKDRLISLTPGQKATLTISLNGAK